MSILKYGKIFAPFDNGLEVKAFDKFWQKRLIYKVKGSFWSTATQTSYVRF